MIRALAAVAVLVAALLCWPPPSTTAFESVSIPLPDGTLQIPGYWFPTSATEPRPAVISLHGCGGLIDDRGRLLSRNRIRIAEYLNVEGIHMLATDSFTPRGETSICEQRAADRRIQYEDRRADVFAAIRWLAQQPTVDKDRIAIVGYSHGGSTVLTVLDRTERAVREQPIQPRAAVAFYPGCSNFVKMWRYAISAPLLLMIGESDDWTPAAPCEQLYARLAREQKDASFELILYPHSHHGFDGYGPVTIRTGLPTKTGRASVGGNPEARDKALRRMFEFLSVQLGSPLRLTHDERFKGHRYVVPPASGFARIDDVAAVPVREKGQERYRHYLGQDAPKAFVVTEKGGWYLSADDAHAMATTTELCATARVKCWLYAVDDRVVWKADPRDRIDASRLQRKPE